MTSMTYQKVLAPRHGPPEVLQIVAEEIPEPKADEVIVKMTAAGVSFADVMWLSGKVPGGPKAPFVPGYDVIGTIDKTGSAVTDFSVGDTVAALVQSGGFAEYVITPQHRLVKVPGDLDLIPADCLKQLSK